MKQDKKKKIIIASVVLLVVVIAIAVGVSSQSNKENIEQSTTKQVTEVESKTITELVDETTTIPTTETTTQAQETATKETTTKKKTNNNNSGGNKPAPKPAPKPQPKPETTTKKPVKHTTPQQVQNEVNAYIRSKGVKVDSSLRPIDHGGYAGYYVPNSFTQETLDNGITLKNCKGRVDHTIKNIGSDATMYCYYNASNQSFYVLYIGTCN